MFDYTPHTSRVKVTPLIFVLLSIYQGSQIGACPIFAHPYLGKSVLLFIH